MWSAWEEGAQANAPDSFSTAILGGIYCCMSSAAAGTLKAAFLRSFLTVGRPCKATLGADHYPIHTADCVHATCNLLLSDKACRGETSVISTQILFGHS